VKHSQVDNAWISINPGKNLIITVKDDGIGFEERYQGVSATDFTI